MMLTGGVGLALIAIGTPTTFILGAALAFSAGWGWTGLLLATTLRLVARRAENAGHTVQIGIYTGAAIAPYTFATLSSAFGDSGAALISATAAFAGAAAMTARRPGGGLPVLVVEVAAGGQASGSTSGCVNRTGLPSDRA